MYNCMDDKANGRGEINLEFQTLSRSHQTTAFFRQPSSFIFLPYSETNRQSRRKPVKTRFDPLKGAGSTLWEVLRP